MAKVINFRVQKGVPLARQRGLADALNMVFDILNGIEGDGSVSIQKVGRDWRIVCDASATSSGTSGGIPDGYEEREVKLFCEGEILTATILVKTTGLVSTAYGSDDKRLLLQVTEPETDTFKLALDKGYLKE